MLIKIDYRESDLHSECIQIVSFGKYKTPIKIVSENLPIGDIIICHDDGSEVALIERKTLNDLAASILDGRYTEQGFRLHNCSVHNHNIYYLIEGDLKYYKNPRVDKQTILSSFVSITHFKGFSLHKSNDIRQSAEWIVQFANKVGKETSMSAFYTAEASSSDNSMGVKGGVPPDTDPTGTNTDPTGVKGGLPPGVPPNESHTGVKVGVPPGATPLHYSQVIKRVKKENITPENIGEIMLSQIPNVSASTAISIMKQFKTIASLITSLQNDEHCLDHIKNEIGKDGKERKINKTSISSIRKYLLPSVSDSDKAISNSDSDKAISNSNSDSNSDSDSNSNKDN
jgi:ERCC4-type nuclease